MKTLPLKDLQVVMSNPQIIALLVQEEKISHHEADFYLTILNETTRGDVAISSEQEMAEFMRLRDVDSCDARA